MGQPQRGLLGVLSVASMCTEHSRAANSCVPSRRVPGFDNRYDTRRECPGQRTAAPQPVSRESQIHDAEAQPSILDAASSPQPHSWTMPTLVGSVPRGMLVKAGLPSKMTPSRHNSSRHYTTARHTSPVFRAGSPIAHRRQHSSRNQASARCSTYR